MAFTMQQQVASRQHISASSRCSRTAAPRPAAAAAPVRRQQLAALCRKQPQQQELIPGQRRQQLYMVYAAATDATAAGEADGLDPNIPAVDRDFDLLSSEIKKLQECLSVELKGCSIYLIGMMGSGKSTAGKMLANTLKYAFFDTDGVIERAHPGESISDIFSKYGEEYFRNCESQVLKELAPYKNLVVATGGGAVTRPKNWSYMHNGIVAWLQGEPDLLAKRVVAEGIEKRPLLFGDGVSEHQAYEISLDKLQQLLDKRTRYYDNADVRVDLRGHGKDAESGAPAAVVMYRLMQAVHKKIQRTQEERESRRQFTIDRASEVPTMRKEAAKGPQAAEE